MSNEACSSCQTKSDTDNERLPSLNPNPGTSKSTNDDSGLFFSPQPYLSKLVRCASTPLTDKSLHSLLNLDFEYLSSDRTKICSTSKPDLDLLTTNLSSVEEHPELTKSPSDPLITRVNLVHQDDSQECQELSLSFKCPDNFARQTSVGKTARKKDCRSRLSGPVEYPSPSDSGFSSDISSTSILSTGSETSRVSIDGASAISNVKIPSKDRDIFDSKKKTKSDLENAATKPFQRGVRFAHIPGVLEGRDYLDFICLFSEMGMVHVLSKIWRLLSLEDLGRVQQVCATWRACLISDREANSRWKEAKEIYMENVNLYLTHAPLRVRLLKSSPRKALSSVTNLLASPSKMESKRNQDHIPAPVTISPSKFRHKLFAEEASRLSPEEELQKCPRCTMPCRVNRPQNIAQCTRISCQFSFCPHCMYSVHGGSPCRFPSRVTRSKAGVSSKKSRSRLRRL